MPETSGGSSGERARAEAWNVSTSSSQPVVQSSSSQPAVTNNNASSSANASSVDQTPRYFFSVYSNISKRIGNFFSTAFKKSENSNNRSPGTTTQQRDGSRSNNRSNRANNRAIDSEDSDSDSEDDDVVGPLKGKTFDPNQAYMKWEDRPSLKFMDKPSPFKPGMVLEEAKKDNQTRPSSDGRATDQPPSCKICYDDTNELDSEEGELLSPCSCRGTSQYIHRGCLKQWHVAQGYPANLACPTCMQMFFGEVALDLAQMNVKHLRDLQAQNKDNPSASPKTLERWRVECAHAEHQRGKKLSSLGRYQEAIQTYQLSLKLITEIKGPLSPHMASCYSDMAEVFRLQGKYNEALKFQRLSLEINEMVLGKNHIDTAKSYNNYGLVLQTTGELEQAMEFFQKAVTVYNFQCPDHPNMATSLNNMATLKRSLGDLPRAHELYCHSLSIREKVYGYHHPATAESYNNIALVLSELGQLEEGLKMSEQCVFVAKHSYEADHPELLNFWGNYGIVLKANGNLVDSRKHLTHAIDGLRKRGIEPSHVWIRKFVDHLSELSFQGGPSPEKSDLAAGSRPTSRQKTDRSSKKSKSPMPDEVTTLSGDIPSVDIHVDSSIDLGSSTPFRRKLSNAIN